ncbi:MAG: hypothetical protein R3B93_19160 [Bacteroidia bacterium]
MGIVLLQKVLEYKYYRNGDWRLINIYQLPPPHRLHAVLNWQQNANIYPTSGDRMYIQYPSRKVPENIEFRFFDEVTKTWDPIPPISGATQMGPNKFILDVSGLTDDQTYLVSVINTEGEEEYFRILKRNF